VASPKGNRLAWIFDAQGVRNIWVAEGPEFKPRQLTSYMDDDGQELSEISFRPMAIRFFTFVAAGKTPSAKRPIDV